MPKKRDPYNADERWHEWIQSNPNIDGLKYNSNLIISFLKDFELGKNISKVSQKGERSSIRLMSLKSRLTFFSKQFKNKKFTSLTKDDVHILFKKMRDGTLKKENGKPYTSAGSYVKDWKCFWNWLIKTNKVKEDINEDISRLDDKAKWVYLDEDQFKTLLNHSIPDYRPLIAFMLDTGARVTEAYNIRVSDFQEDFNKVTIRAETSKNKYERTINLKICTQLIKEFISFHNLKGDDYIFIKNPPAFNKYLRQTAEKLFGDKVSHNKAGAKYSQMSLYDIRHIASCYWLKRYQTYRALMYRMGWTSEKWIKYYSEFLGQNDELSDEDMLTQEDKTKYERQSKEIADLKKKFSEESLRKKVWDIFSEFQQKQKKLEKEAGVKDSPIVFGSLYKEKPDKKTQEKQKAQMQNAIKKYNKTAEALGY